MAVLPFGALSCRDTVAIAASSLAAGARLSNFPLPTQVDLTVGVALIRQQPVAFVAPLVPAQTLIQSAFDAEDPLGVDLSLAQDLDAGGSMVSGLTGLAQALLRRLTTPRGGLFYDPGYGTDIRAFLGEALTQSAAQAAIQQSIEQELSQDERVLSVSATVTFSAAGTSLTGHVVVQTADGPFTMVLDISKLAVTILKAG